MSRNSTKTIYSYFLREACSFKTVIMLKTKHSSILSSDILSLTSSNDRKNFCAASSVKPTFGSFALSYSSCNALRLSKSNSFSLGFFLMLFLISSMVDLSYMGLTYIYINSAKCIWQYFLAPNRWTTQAFARRIINSINSCLYMADLRPAVSSNLVALMNCSST